MKYSQKYYNEFCQGFDNWVAKLSELNINDFENHVDSLINMSEKLIADIREESSQDLEALSETELSRYKEASLSEAVYKLSEEHMRARGLSHDASAKILVASEHYRLCAQNLMERLPYSALSEERARQEILVDREKRISSQNVDRWLQGTSHGLERVRSELEIPSINDFTFSDSEKRMLDTLTNKDSLEASEKRLLTELESRHSEYLNNEYIKDHMESLKVGFSKALEGSASQREMFGEELRDFARSQKTTVEIINFYNQFSLDGTNYEDVKSFSNLIDKLELDSISGESDEGHQLHEMHEEEFSSIDFGDGDLYDSGLSVPTLDDDGIDIDTSEEAVYQKVKEALANASFEIDNPGTSSIKRFSQNISPALSEIASREFLKEGDADAIKGYSRAVSEFAISSLKKLGQKDYSVSRITNVNEPLSYGSKVALYQKNAYHTLVKLSMQNVDMDVFNETLAGLKPDVNEQSKRANMVYKNICKRADEYKIFVQASKELKASPLTPEESKVFTELNSKYRRLMACLGDNNVAQRELGVKGEYRLTLNDYNTLLKSFQKSLFSEGYKNQTNKNMQRLYNSLTLGTLDFGRVLEQVNKLQAEKDIHQARENKGPPLKKSATRNRLDALKNKMSGEKASELIREGAQNSKKEKIAAIREKMAEAKAEKNKDNELTMDV